MRRDEERQEETRRDEERRELAEVDHVYAVGLFYYGCRDSRTFHRSGHCSSVCCALESAAIRFTIWILLSLSE